MRYNAIRAFRYSYVISRYVYGRNVSRPYKRYAGRNNAVMRVLALLMAVDESFDEILERVKETYKTEIEKEAEEIMSKESFYMRQLYAKEGDELREEIKDALAALYAAYLAQSDEPLGEEIRKKIIAERLLEPFGGYGTFSLAASSYGIGSLYVELNPVAYFFFKTYARGMPENARENASKLLKELEEVVGDLYDQNAYVTIHARLARCPRCGSLIPVVRREKGKIYREVRAKKKTYHVEPKKVGDKEYDRIFKIEEGRGSDKFYCPSCGREVEIKREHLDFSKYYASVVPIGVFYRKEDSLKASEEEFSRFKEAIEILEANRDYIKDYIPLEEIPKSILGEKKLSGLELYKYRTQLMTPRQILAYATIVRFLRELEGEERDRLAMVAMNALHFNVLNRYVYRGNKLPDVTADDAYYFSYVPTEASIPGPTYRGTLRRFLSSEEVWKKREKETYNAGKELEFKLLRHDVVEGMPERGQLGVLNEAVQRLHEYLEMQEAFDAVFIDPPYLDAIPYFDVSYLPYVWLKKIYGRIGKYDLEEIRERDITESKISEFSKRLKEALENIGSLLKPEGFAVLQFAPPEKKNFKHARISVLSAALEAHLIPVMASYVIAEKGSGKPFKTGMIRTIMVLLSKRPVEIIEREPIKEAESVDEAIEMLKKFLGSISFENALREFIEENFGSPRIEEIVPLTLSLISPYIYKAFPRGSIEEYVEIFNKLRKDIVGSVLNTLINRIKIDMRDKYSSAAIIALLEGVYDKRILKIILEEAGLNTKVLEYSYQISKSRSKFLNILNLEQALSKAPEGSFMHKLFEVYASKDREIEKPKEEPLAGPMKEALETYIRAIEEILKADIKGVARSTLQKSIKLAQELLEIIP